MDIAALADEETVVGFRLAGVEHGVVFSEETVEDALAEVGGAKILILTERVAEHLRARGLMRKVTATVAEVPDKSGSSGAAVRQLSRLFEEAIGVKLKE